jgi:hypothetical protein
MPWQVDPIGAMLGPISLLVLWPRKRKRGKLDTLIVLLVLVAGKSLGLTACQPPNGNGTSTSTNLNVVLGPKINQDINRFSNCKPDLSKQLPVIEYNLSQAEVSRQPIGVM